VITRHLILIAVAVVVTVAVTPLVRRLSLRYGLVDHPGGRKVHTEPISRLGGVAIFAGVAASIAAQVIGERWFGWNGGFIDDVSAGANLLGVLIGLIMMFAVGLVDDLYDLSPGIKFSGQIVAAAVVAASGLRIEYIGDPFGGGLVLLGLLAIPVTILYLVGFANVINLIDGLDGLAAGVSAIAATSLMLLAIQGNRFDAAAIAAAVIGACIGFLRFNFNPASIFMGDSGAMFLGFTLATVSLLGVMKTTAAIALAVPLLIIGVPIFDTASAIIRRLRHKRPIQEADKGHIHHRLLGRGFDQRQTVLIIYLWSVALSVGGYTVRHAAGPVKLVALVTLFAVTAAMAHWLGLYEAAHAHDDSGHEKLIST
jgi:UDP-GlcNAc:undecaprenyl-phosphate/decaprenyl-phosphate GlcNAc-1-phosphate transferase